MKCEFLESKLHGCMFMIPYTRFLFLMSRCEYTLFRAYGSLFTFHLVDRRNVDDAPDCIYIEFDYVSEIDKQLTIFDV